jgi:DNA-binding GntR family transcriptional regulator
MQAPPLTQRPATKQAFVYQTLHSAIMRGELAPGERLRTGDIAQRLGVSVIPVRETLQVLHSERLGKARHPCTNVWRAFRATRSSKCSR